MRSVSSGFTNIAKSDVRIVSAYAVVKDHRIRFSNLNKLANDDALYDGAMHSHDCAASGSTIYRVANIGNQLWYMYISNPGGSWPTWQNSGRSLKADSMPGIFYNCVWYQKPDNSIVRANFSGSSLGSEIDVSLSPSNTLAIAPFSVDEAVIRLATPGNNSARIAYIQDKNVGIGTLYYWSGRIYQADVSSYGHEDMVFDAEKDPLTGWVHVFWGDEKIGRVKTMKFSHIAGRFSPVEGVIPMDVVDDLNNFKLGGVTTPTTSSSWGVKPPSTAGTLWLGGSYVRTDGGHMQVYMEGPPWTFGRDVFVGTDGTEARTSGGKDVPVAGGKLLFIGSKVYYVGPGIAYEANGTDWTGDSSPSYTINDIESWSYNQQPNQAARVQIEIPYSVSHSALREGSEITLYATYQQEGGSSYSAKVGTFNIDVLLEAQEGQGEYKTIVARSASGKALEMWAPDTSYDYWGADSKVALAASLTELIRMDGTIVEENGYLQANGFNDWVSNYDGWGTWNKGHMYSLARPSRGGICKIRFRYDTDTLYDPQVGITLNLYRETKEEAEARLDDHIVKYHGGVLPWWHYGITTIAVVWGSREHNDGPGVSIKWISMSDWTFFGSGEEVWSGSWNPSPDTDYWLMTKFTEGVLEVYYRADSSTSWTLLTTQTFGESAVGDLLPWHRTDQKGRFGLYLYNETPWINNDAMIGSDALYMPFRELTDQHGRNFPFPDTYIVDQEQIYVSSVVGSNDGWGTNSSIEGHVWTGVSQPYPNAYKGPWTGYQGFWSHYTNSHVSKDYFDGMIAVNNDSGRQYEISDWDYHAPQQWVPNTSPWPDNWIDHVGDGAYGSWNTSQTVRTFFTEEPRNVRKGQEWRVRYKGVCNRAQGGTQQTTHNKDSLVHLFTDSRVKVDRFHAFTNEREWSMADMMTEIARKAGIVNIYPKFHMDPSDTVTRSASTWALDSQMNSHGVRQANVVARARRNDWGTEFGIQFGRVKSGSQWNQGWAVMIDPSNDYITLYDADSKAIQERITEANSNHDGWHTFSVQKNRVNVYESETLIASFKLDTDINTQSYAGPAYRGITCVYDWPELSLRVDNFIMDIGKRGSQILGQIIGQKRLYWQDDEDGNLRLYRDRVTANSGDPWTMTANMANTFNEADLVTRVRVEGAEAWTAIDEDAVVDHGNIFRVFNAEDAENQQDAAVEAEWLLDETAKRSDQFTLHGPADLRVEAGDEYIVDLPSGQVTVIVDSVQMQMRTTLQDAIFDMTLQAHNAE